MDAVSVLYTCEYSRVGVPCIPSHGCSRPYSHPPPLLMPSVLPSGTKKERCPPAPVHLLVCPALLHAVLSFFVCALHCVGLRARPVRTPCRMAAACARSRQVQAYHQHPRPSARNRAQIARRHTFSAAPPAAPAGLAPGRVSVYGPADVGAPAGWFVPTGLTAQQHQQGPPRLHATKAG